MNQYQSFAHRLHEQGFNVTAIEPGEKKPWHPWACWQETRQMLDDVNGLPWLRAGGVGVIPGIGGLRIFDFDEKRKGYPAVPFDVVTAVLEKLGLPTSYPWAWRSGSGSGYGIGVLCFDALPPSILATNGPGVFKAAGVGFDHLELRWARCQTVLPPSTHPTGPGYTWIGGEPTEPPATVTAAQCIAAFQAVTIAPTPKISQPTHKVRQPANFAPTDDYTAAQRNLTRLAAWRCDDYDSWVHVGMALSALGEPGFGLWDAWSQGSAKYRADEMSRKWSSFKPDDGYTLASLTYWANEDDPPLPRPAAVASLTPTPEEPPWLRDAPDPFDAGPPAFVLDGAPTPAPSSSTATANPLPDLSECSTLPASAQLDLALGKDASPWLDAYIAFSRQWAPRAFDGFHEAVGLWVLSTVAARRVKLDFGGERYPSLYLVNVARSSVWTKSTAHHIGGALLDACGLSWLLAPDDATPQALLARMATPVIVGDWDAMPPDVRERAQLALAFAGQKGWDFDEFGSKVSAIMREAGSMADFRGILRRFDDAPGSYTYATVGRGENRLTRPYLALMGSMTPADMGPFAKRGGALWRDGFWARFAFVAPSPDDQPTMGRFPGGARSFPADLVSQLRAWHDRLGVPSVDVVQRKDGDGKPTREFDVTVTAQPPAVCGLAADVREAFYAYHDGLTTLAAASDNADLDGNYSRFAEKALRVAILLASLENGGRIEMRHWARAQTITERWRRSLHDLYRTLNLAQTEAARNEDRTTDLVRRLGAATAVDVKRYAPDLATTEIATILERLARAGVLRVAEKTRKGTLRYALGES